MRPAAVLLWLLCGGIAVAQDAPPLPPVAPAGAAIVGPVPMPRPRPPLWAEPHTFREAVGPDFKSEEVTSEPSDCRKRLDLVAAISAMPRLMGPGACGGGDMVQLDAVLIPGKGRIAVKPAPVLRCAMAEQLALWIRDDAAPKVAAAGPALRSIETYDDYSCRGRNRIVGARMSEHGKGNAVDIRSLTTVDGKVMQPTDIKASKELRDALRASACARFSTILGPGSDGYHEEHIHLDLAERRGNYRICQWEVREPPPPSELVYAQIDGNPLPLPPRRPAAADAH